MMRVVNDLARPSFAESVGAIPAGDTNVRGVFAKSERERTTNESRTENRDALNEMGRHEMRKFTENGPELKAGLRCAFQWNEFWNDPAEISPLGNPGCKNRTQEKKPGHSSRNDRFTFRQPLGHAAADGGSDDTKLGHELRESFGFERLRAIGERVA